MSLFPCCGGTRLQAWSERETLLKRIPIPLKGIFSSLDNVGSRKFDNKLMAPSKEASLDHERLERRVLVDHFSLWFTVSEVFDIFAKKEIYKHLIGSPAEVDGA